jgi:hypothetical protein
MKVQNTCLWVLVPFLLIDCIEITKAFASPRFEEHRARLNGDDVDRSYIDRSTTFVGSIGRKSPLAHSKYRHSRTQPLAISLDPMRSQITSAPTSPEMTSKRKREARSDSATTFEETTSNAPKTRNMLNYFLEVTRASLRSTYTNISPIIPGFQQKGQVVELVDINWLKTHEEVLIDRVGNLKQAIQEWNEYRMPLLVDCNTGAILDGHHRYHVGRELGLSRLPVVLVDYLEDDTIDVDVWPECGIDCLCKEEVIQMSLSDEVFPPKTSRHDFVSEMSPISIPLSKLF